jgi:hypothetical protein
LKKIGNVPALIGGEFTLCVTAGGAVMVETWMRRAERYQNRAEEMRIMADNMKRRDTKDSFQQLAREYDKMAESCLKYAVNDVRCGVGDH